MVAYTTGVSTNTTRAGAAGSRGRETLWRGGRRRRARRCIRWANEKARLTASIGRPAHHPYPRNPSVPSSAYTIGNPSASATNWVKVNDQRIPRAPGGRSRNAHKRNRLNRNWHIINENRIEPHSTPRVKLPILAFGSFQACGVLTSSTGSIQPEFRSDLALTIAFTLLRQNGTKWKKRLQDFFLLDLFCNLTKYRIYSWHTQSRYTTVLKLNIHSHDKHFIVHYFTALMTTNLQQFQDPVSRLTATQRT